MPSPRKPKKDKIDFEKEPAFQKLVADISKLAEEARAKGVDLGARWDTLSCSGCGSYEDFTREGAWQVRDKNGEVLKDESFILISQEEKSRYCKDKVHFRIYFTFICTVCGLYQVEVVRETFDR